nr:hypothetical protein [Tanacetum cinerariifolium]
MQALKESKKASKRQLGTEGSSEGTCTTARVLDESMVVSTTSNEGTESEYSKEDQLDDKAKDDKEGDADDEGDDHISVTQDTDDEDDETESNEDKSIKVSDAAKADAKKTKEEKDDSKKSELPPIIGTVKDTANVKISSLLDINIQYEVPHTQSPSVLRVPVSMIFKPTILTPTQETSSASPVTTLPLPSDTFKLKKIYHSAKALATLKSQVPTVVEQYFRSKISGDLQKTLTINLEQEYKKSASEILKIKKEQAEKQKMLKYTIKSIDKAALKEYDQKSSLYQTIYENKSLNKNHANHRLYHALIEALKEEKNAIDKGVVDIIKDHKRKHDDDDEDPLATPNHGKKIKSKSASIKEPVKKPIAEVVMDDVGKDVIWNETSIKLYLDNLNSLGSTKWSLLQRILSLSMISWPLLLNSLSHLTIAADYFFNNDLEYLKSSDPKGTYTTSITKTKGARYEIEGIEEYGSYALESYQSRKTLGVKSVSVKKLHGYGHLEDMMVKRADRQLYKFKE